MDFKPPKPNPVVISFTRLMLPRALKSRNVTEVVFEEQDLKRLREMRSARVALFPNHPSNTEPAVMFALSKRVNEPFYYLCCREAFDSLHGLWGWLLQRVGAYSIVRGSPDRESFKTTRRLLAKPGTKLVIFPEGEVYSQNDALLPFHSGVTQLLFWAQEDLIKQGDEKPIYVMPVAIKYKFTQDMRPAINASINRLETALALPSNPSEETYARLRRIGETVVEKLEKEYGIAKNKTLNLAERMNALKQALIERVAAGLQVTPRGDTLPEKMRALINALNEVTKEEAAPASAYDARLRQEDRNRALPLLHDLDRLANWIAVYDGYVGARPTPERMADTLRRLEIEVLGKAQCIGDQRCFARLGEPINIGDYYEAYLADKRATVQALTRQFEAAVQDLLNEISLSEQADSAPSTEAAEGNQISV